jgi:hypothetical protein
MNAIRISRVLTLASAIALASAGAHADIFAATCRPGASGVGGDIAILNASTGALRALPAGVNSADAEFNPTISTDGRRLAFRRSGASNTQFVIVVDLATGQSASLFSGFDVAQTPILGSAITPDGTTVATGRPLRQVLSFWLPQVTLTSLATFPAGPFARTTLTPTRLSFGNRASDLGRVESVATGASGNLFAMQIHQPFAGSDIGSLIRRQLVLAQRDGSSSPPLRSTAASFSEPALAASSPASVLFVQRNLRTEGDSTFMLPGDIVFRPATLAGFSGTPTVLRLGVSTNRNESLPALTADARYVGFVRDAEEGNDRLFVWNSQTQTLLNPSGVDLGRRFSSGCGSLSLYVQSVLASSVITSTGTVTVSLVSTASIGIFVQRIVGKTEVLGRKAYELETVGRFPLGMYGAGNVFTHWDFEVNGEPLEPGKYLVTVRAVEGDIVRELGQSQVLKVHENGRISIRETEEDQ